jgi:hypothetical protein
LPWLFPHTDARSWFTGSAELREANAFRNSSLQGAYLMLAARALGLDCGRCRVRQRRGRRRFFADQPNVRRTSSARSATAIPASISGAARARIRRLQQAVVTRRVRTLVIDSATEACSVACSRTGARRGRYECSAAAMPSARADDRRAARQRPRRAHRRLARPGSFTGVRIGLAAARGAGLAWQAEVSATRRSAWSPRWRAGASGPSTVCMTGGHGEWFVQDFGRRACPETELPR